MVTATRLVTDPAEMLNAIVSVSGVLFALVTVAGSEPAPVWFVR